MTTPLDSYLHGPYKEDVAFLKRLTNVIQEVIPLFYNRQEKLPYNDANPEKKVNTWPYGVSLQNGEVHRKGERFSASTHCMILFALDAFGPRAKEKYSLLLGKTFRPISLSGNSNDWEKLQNSIVATKQALVTVVSEGLENPLVSSGTYGNDDPFTLTWLTEIAFRWTSQPNVTEAQFNGYRDKILRVVNRVFAERKNKILDTSNTEFNEVTSSFLELRRLHLAKAAKRFDEPGAASSVSEWLETSTPELWKTFDGTINRQLSYSAMNDPRFDPAELALAFEGALLLHSAWIGRYTIDQVFDALTLSRDRHPFWRPVTPFLANDRGHVLFLISIEVANSILRACEVLDEDEGLPTRFSQIEAQLRSYALWLLGEVEEVSDPSPNAPNLVGWRTEYEGNRDTIQLWHTSHVLVFLAHYASLLKRKIAADGIDAAGLQTHPPKKKLIGYWSSEPLSNLAGQGSKHYSVLGQINEKYIKSRALDGNAFATKAAPLYSMLLYGPPGTGKTTVAKQIAAALDFPLIVVTVSDFLAAGAPEIENRAKGVFEVLRSQDHVVILFDEIDQFLLDRNSKYYRDQDDVFKFMTPGMLTKLQDLRDAENCIFIVATNYYERIDSAIKRRGRIDEHFLLCIPDQEQRLKLLKDFTRMRFKRILNDEKEKEAYNAAAITGDAKSFLVAVSQNELTAPEFGVAITERDILGATVLFGRGDIENLVESKTVPYPGMDFNSFADAMKRNISQVDSAVSLSAYHSRFDGDGEPPFEEFFLLLYLLAESNKTLDDSEKLTIQYVLDALPGFNGDNFKPSLEKFAKETTIVDKIEEYLPNDLFLKWKKDNAAQDDKQNKQADLRAGLNSGTD